MSRWTEAAPSTPRLAPAKAGERGPFDRWCDKGHNDAPTFEYKEYLHPTVNGAYRVYCRLHAKWQRALHYRLVSIR